MSSVVSRLLAWAQRRKTGDSKILAWEDDPMAAAKPISRPIPRLRHAPLPIAIVGRTPPAKAYKPGTWEFRYWTAAEALQRGIEFWSNLLPEGTHWRPLQVTLDMGALLNAFYDRANSELEFYHYTVGEKTIYLGESPDVVCHELGHAVLDAFAPWIFIADLDETSAFHESFGDISSILCALQLPSLRREVLDKTGGAIYQSSRLSRLAEQFGWAVRQLWPDQAEPDCIRNAVNSFFYQDPQTLPFDAPSTSLSTEEHSFSRIFTGGFFEALSEMLVIENSSPAEADLLKVSKRIARLLIDAALIANISPKYYREVATCMIEADTIYFNKKYQDALKTAFLGHGLLSPEEAKAATNVTHQWGSLRRRRQKRALVATIEMIEVENLVEVRAGETELEGEAVINHNLTLVPLSAREYNLDVEQILVHAPAELEQLGASELEALKFFVDGLFYRGQVDVGTHGYPSIRTAHPFVSKTHKLVEQPEGLTLARQRFSYRFD